jgi:hypothetical protein
MLKSVVVLFLMVNGTYLIRFYIEIGARVKGSALFPRIRSHDPNVKYSSSTNKELNTIVGRLSNRISSVVYRESVKEK